MAYNYLREAISIRNSTLCEFDTNSAYEVTWNENGNLEGWDSYSQIHAYGVWNGVLFGTSYGGDCYFARSSIFPPVEAEDYYTLVFQMKVDVADQNRNNITGGKVQWLRSGDLIWDEDKSTEFDVVTTDSKWRTYIINLGPEQWYQGDIRNLRIYPFLNSRRGDRFFVRFIALRSETVFKCTNISCSYYSQYEHLCPGVGEYGACKAGIALSSTIDIVKDVNDRLIVNVDDFGDQPVRLLPASGLTRSEIARELERNITKIDIGGYVNTTVEEVADKIKINSGTLATDSSVVVKHSQLAEDLGFFDGTTDVSTKTTGTDPATGFEYKSSYRLRGVEIFKLIDGDTDTAAFYHDPSRYEVEAGRRDWQEKSKGYWGGYDKSDPEVVYSPTFDGEGYTIVDFTHPFNSNGRVTRISVMGSTDPTVGAKVKIFRPKLDGTLTVVDEVSFGIEEAGNVYSGEKDTYVIETDVWVRKGDLVGFYNLDIYLGDVINDELDAMYFYFNGEATGTFDPGELKAHGNFGLNYYARGDRYQDLVMLEIDMGDRVNISSLSVYGEEITEDFEYNIAICDDINWSVNLFGESHNHQVDNTVVPENSYVDTHLNIAYGTSLLGDGITHTNDALAGTSYGFDANGFYTGGSTYFYVNGDAEWLNETPGENWGYPTWVGNTPTGYYTDPIAFNLLFSDELEIHKTRIFFKERDNFDRFHWAYYVGSFSGNTYNSNYKYIPAYTTVTVDGIVFDADDEDMDEGAREFLFNNPTNRLAEIGAYDPATGRNLITNPAEYFGAAFIKWNVVAHEFSPITTEAVQLYTNRHQSTKLMEIEVYSKTSNDPSLLDDVIVEYSREDDVWFSASLEDVEIDNEIVAAALINDNPRYINLEVRSSSTIKFYEFDLQLNEDAVRSGDNKCQEAVFPTATKRGAVNPAKSFPIWNTYEESLNMQVDIPRDEGDSRLILWSKMGSADELAIPEYGPAGYYYKNPDYPLQNDDYNVAINCPCWGLQNLANGKDVYYNYGDTEWFYWGTYSSGTSLALGHPNKRITEFEFTPISAKYFKFVPVNAQFSGVSELIFYYDGAVVDYTAYALNDITPSTPFSTPAPELTDGDFTTGSYRLLGNPFTIDDFDGTSLDTDLWTAINGTYQTVAGGYLTFAPNSNTYSYIHSENKWYIPQGAYWRVEIEFDLLDWVGNPPSSQRHEIELIAEAKTTQEYVSVVRWKYSGSESVGTFYATDWTPDTGEGGNSTSGFDTAESTDLYLKLERVSSNTIRTYYGSAANGDEWSFDRSGFSDETTGFFIIINTRCGVKGAPRPSIRLKHVHIYTSTEGLVGGGFIAHSPIDTVRLVHSRVGNLVDWTTGEGLEIAPQIDVYASYDNVHYFLHESVTSYSIYDETFDTYLAFDLDKRHSLDMVRHYGSGASGYAISSDLKYFSDDVSDPNLIAHTGPETGSEDDCRWLMITIPETETVRKIGIYPNIGIMTAPGGGYNHEWDDLGTILTDYNAKTNVAYGATVSGSSFFEGMTPEFITDGIIPDGDVSRVWGSDESATQWLKIYLDGEYTVDEFRCYWGYYDIETAWMVEDYKIYTSTDDITYVERVAETGNSDHFRTHILASGVPARYVRIDIESYIASEMEIDTEDGAETFEGAFVREIEVLEAGNLTFVDSEKYPIVAVNLLTQFQINDHSLTPVYPDDSSFDWSNSDSNFRYSANTFSDPSKVEYSAYGASLTESQWVSVKRDTATEWNSGPDYLDAVRLLSSDHHLIHKYPWWWTSNYSTLSSDYAIFTSDAGCSMKIEYTGGATTSGIEEIVFIEGTSLGTDERFSEMDFLSFDLYISDVTKLDDYGTVVFGDYEGLRYHIWDLSTTISGLSNGWNYLELQFKEADTKITNEGVTSYYVGTSYALNNYYDLELKSFRFNFKGKGDPFTIYLDNLRIERNTFHEDVKFGKGLYLANTEYVSFPLSEFDPHQGTIEFWLKPDYNYYGMNNFYQIDSRTLFCFSNVANDIFGLFIKAGRGLAIVTGNSDYVVPQYAERSSDAWFYSGDIIHVGFVWSNDGTEIDSHGTTIRLYINNELIGSSYYTWEIRETKTSRLLIGGSVTQKATLVYPKSFWAVMDNLKVYNYCKTDFSDRNTEESALVDVVSPNSFLEISKDGVNFYDRNSVELPLVYEHVPPGESRTVWVRTNIPKNLTGAEKRTAELIIEAIRSF